MTSDSTVPLHPFRDYQPYVEGLVSDFRKRFRPGSDPGAVAERVFEIHEAELFEMAGASWTTRAQVELKMASELAGPLRALDSMIGFSYALVHVLGENRRSERVLPADVRYCTSALSVGGGGGGRAVMGRLTGGVACGAFPPRRPP